MALSHFVGTSSPALLLEAQSFITVHAGTSMRARWTLIKNLIPALYLRI